MYEMERFNWQKLLIHNVPHKGGRSYAAVTPPPDYSPQWNAAQNVIQNSANSLSELANRYRQISTLSDPVAQFTVAEQLNAGVDAKVREIDDVVAKVNSIPDSAFNTEQLSTLGLSKAGAIGLITANRTSLLGLKTTINIPVTPPPPPPPPPPTVIITPPVVITPGRPDYDGVGQGERLVPFVVSPAYAANGILYPADSDVPAGLPYYVKPQAGVTYTRYSPPPPPYIPPPYIPTYYEVLSAEVERQTKQLQAFNRIWNKPIDPAPATEIYPSSSWQYEFWAKGYSLQEISYGETIAAQRGLLDKSNGDFALFKKQVEDVIQDAILEKPGQPRQIISPIMEEIVVQPGIADPAFTIELVDPEIGVLTPPPLSGWPRVPPPTCDLPLPLPPNSNPKKLPRRRGFTPTMPSIDLPLPNPIGGVRCGTNTVPRPGSWEDALIGAGSTVDELDTIRRMMTRAKFANGADQAAAAIGMLETLRNQNGTNATVVDRPPPFLPGQGGRGLPPLPPVSKAQEAEQRRQVARERALNRTTANPISKIPGVEKMPVSAPVAVRANTIAKRQTSLARRGALNGRNLRSM